MGADHQRGRRVLLTAGEGMVDQRPAQNPVDDTVTTQAISGSYDRLAVRFRQNCDDERITL